MKYLNKTVRTIFVILGKGCNFHCQYCMQNKTQKERVVYPTEINEDIYDFIEEIAANQDEVFYIHFYGGEPLVYKDKLKTITERLCHLKNAAFSVITNGSLIDEDLVKFFNDHRFSVNVSWDGRFSSTTRKCNVFEINKENLFSIKDLGISAVISSATPLDILLDDMQNLSNEYLKVSGHHIRINLDEIFDTDIAERSLLDIDYDKYSEISRSIAKECLHARMNGTELTQEEFNSKYWAKMAFFNKIYATIHRFVEDPEHCVFHMANCCNGIEVLNLDLEGNLYSCHNCDDKLGNIYSDFVNYLDQLFKHDKIQYYLETYCNECPAYPACRGGCKLVSEKARNESYCKLKRAIFVPIIEEIISAVS